MIFKRTFSLLELFVKIFLKLSHLCTFMYLLCNVNFADHANFSISIVKRIINNKTEMKIKNMKNG